MHACFRTRTPSPPLDAFVEMIWVYRTMPRAHTLERILPTGAAQLIVNLKEDHTRLYDPDRPKHFVSSSGTILSGMRSRYQLIDTSEQEYVAGVAFRPGGLPPFVPMPAHELSEIDVPLEAVSDRRRSSRLRERLLEASGADAQLDVLEAELRDLWSPPRRHPAVAFALTLFDRFPSTATVTAVGERIALSPKRFIEHFTRDVGLTPKRYCRVRRFQRAVRLAHGGGHIDWAQLAIDCGYYDQAHFINEFRAFAGVTPTSYAGVRTEFQNHVKFLQ